MATLKKSLSLLLRQTKPYILQKHTHLSMTSAVSAAYWNKDWKPSPLPRTPEERAAAAKKYGLRPEDYNILMDESLGDYPYLPATSHSWRDPFEDYDHPGDKRHYGETFPPDYELIADDLRDPKAFGRYTYGQIVAGYFLIFAGFLLAWNILKPYPYFLPRMPKQYPFNDLYLEKGGDPAAEPVIKHYTFEPATQE
ncbi:NADH dehydrogenase [ubiquinone] 1 beta subcomplex subunit 8, mitochondrial-like [Biomphalaria glabrata]|uniref:NADH dehydrogenase [ubiquinone] 1 beta subcomplex subunit 8, mitochondrial-like n=1 Tax=Biomphalaria glabrata TaxID=6526 RepID=A0A2C9JZ96_BIOGL|nr:NADH dehydrogenase [ubiquinone] 1 beta subcomplex subunit 8, mitochondrial-like [Biomphalaria glabrata]XP_013089984.1 NADH dehydrogenase [ubiquinone] 1 beta subcomplex subunit 8, mitochondrial-like [Biomphalaria glabrata]